MNIALTDSITRVCDEHIGVLKANTPYILSFYMNSRNNIKIEVIDDITNELILRVNKNVNYRNGAYIYPITASKDGNLFMKIGGTGAVNITNIVLEENN
jgi:hypothetical protein